jgi:hypothetical protein
VSAEKLRFALAMRFHPVHDELVEVAMGRRSVVDVSEALGLAIGRLAEALEAAGVTYDDLSTG